MYTNILIPTDGSAHSAHAIRHAVELARATGAKVTGLYVSPSPTPLVFKGILPVGYMPPEAHEKAIARSAKHFLETIEKEAISAGVSCTTLSVRGDFPAESILQTAAAHKCDLIVMASHGRSGIASLLLGSETQKVLAHAKIPVLVHR